MTLPLSGAISLDNVRAELSTPTATNVACNTTNIRELAERTSYRSAIAFSDFYGKWIHGGIKGTLLYTLTNPTPVTDDQFGTTVAVFGKYAVIGAAGDNTGAVDAGSAYVYDLSTGTLLYTLTNPVPASSYFSTGVSISETYVAVSARYTGTVTGQGRVYLYDKLTGAALFTINNPSPQDMPLFGEPIALSDQYVIVGAPRQDYPTNSGIAYVYDMNTSNKLYTFTPPTPLTSAQFGFSCAVYGNYAVVGEPGWASAGSPCMGKAHVYDLTTGQLVHTFSNHVVNPVSATSEFGQSVAITDKYVVVGHLRIGKVYVYNLQTYDLAYELTPGVSSDQYGKAVSASRRYLVIGHYVTVGPYIDVYDIETGVLIVRITSGGSPLGLEIGISDDFLVNGSMFSGGSNVGVAYVYD